MQQVTEDLVVRNEAAARTIKKFGAAYAAAVVIVCAFFMISDHYIQRPVGISAPDVAWFRAHADKAAATVVYCNTHPEVPGQYASVGIACTNAREATQ